MQKFSISSIPYYILLTAILIVPFSISREFFSVNDLPKSSAVIITGSILIIFFILMISYRLLKSEKETIILYYTPGLDSAVLIFLAACVISAVFSIMPSVSFWGQYERQVGLITIIYLTAVYFISGFLLAEGNRVKNALLLIEVITVIISVYAILQFFRIELFNFQSANSRPGSFLGNSVFLGGYLILVLPFSALNSLGKKNKLISTAFPLLIFAGIIVSGTRSAYIAMIFQLIIFLIFRNRIYGKTFTVKKSLINIFILLLVISVIVFLFAINRGMLINRVKDIFINVNPRFILWNDAFNIFLKYPFTGPGIAMFPAALEEFYSNTLRYSDALVSYDHAHNNYLQALFTMGLTGFSAYLYLIYTALRSSVNLLIKNTGRQSDNTLHYAFILMLSGYCIYGLTNFDDISVLFFLYVFLSVLRASSSKRKGYKKFPLPVKYTLYGFGAVIIVLCVINIRNTINFLYADVYFNDANALYEKGDFVKALDFNNKAINLNPRCSAYRFVEASQVYNYCFEYSGMDNVQKQKLLRQVETEINKAKEKLYYVNYCNGLLSLVYFEEGRMEEAEKLKNEVLIKDSMNVNYRIKLTRYLLRSNRLDEVKRNLNILQLVKPKDAVSCLLAAMYYDKLKDSENAVLYGRKVLLAEPNNNSALEIINRNENKK